MGGGASGRSNGEIYQYCLTFWAGKVKKTNIDGCGALEDPILSCTDWDA